MSTANASAEIVDRNGAIAYLTGLKGNVENAKNVEIDILLAGLARLELADSEVIDPIGEIRDYFAAAIAKIETTVDRLATGHGAVSETVNALGADAAARDVGFYENH